jgi:hypothetical protein
MTDRELMQQALDALEHIIYWDNEKPEWEYAHAAITALRERLAQPDAYGYASRLAVAIWEQHYKDVAPQWKPLDDLMGVLTQIDNMTSGLTRLAQPEQEPVAWVCYGASEKHDIDYFQDEVDAIPMGTKLYASPPAQRKPLTEEEINSLWDGHVVPVFGKNGINPIVFARAIEAKLKEKNT